MGKTNIDVSLMGKIIPFSLYTDIQFLKYSLSYDSLLPADCGNRIIYYCAEMKRK
jgi:hypothetical protein